MGIFPPPAPRITLVGAGPGDPELLTLKGLKAIQTANVILYDALLSEELLAYAPADIPLVYVGKRCGAHSLRQEEINDLLITSAYTYGHAVRLKGGDAFVFGRGGEELLAAERAGLAVAVVPGVSSALAVPALAGIPLTHRGVSRGFWVLTATTSGHVLPDDMEQAARSEATVVILMGTRKIREIAALFARHRPTDTPIALLQSGSLPGQVTTIASLGYPETLAAAARTQVQGIVVIGAVVAALLAKKASPASCVPARY